MDKLQKSSVEDVEIIYQAYPRHVGKRNAVKAINKALQRIQSGEYKGQSLSLEMAVAGLRNRTIVFAQSHAGNKGSFTPHPATWFNRSSYLDDPKEWQENEQDHSKQAQRFSKNAVAVANAFSRQNAYSDLSGYGEGTAAGRDRVVEGIDLKLRGD